MNLGYAAPASLDEALAILAERGPDCSIFAGGMSLVPALKQGRLTRRLLVNIKRLGDASARGLRAVNDQLSIGALVRHREIETSALIARHLPALRALEEKLASVQIRNHGTLAGNLCAAEPWSDPPCLLAALDARLLIVAKRGERQASAANWIVGDRSTQQQPDELLLGIDIPLPRAGVGIGYTRLAARQGLARPLACAAARIILSDNGTIVAAGVFVGAVGPRPQRMVEVEKILAGNRLDAALSAAVEDATAHAVDYLPDDRCGASYKMRVAGVLVRRAIADAVAHGKAAEH